MQLRRRNFRNSWTLENNEPVAGNFYPITAAIAIQGPTPSGSHIELALVTDRAQVWSELNKRMTSSHLKRWYLKGLVSKTHNNNIKLVMPLWIEARCLYWHLQINYWMLYGDSACL